MHFISLQILFAKPKNFDVNTPHFEQKVDGTLEVHEDSACGKSFRVMSVKAIYSSSFYSGSTFAANEGIDMAVLHMNPTAKGFAIDTRCMHNILIIADGTGNEREKGTHLDYRLKILLI